MSKPLSREITSSNPPQTPNPHRNSANPHRSPSRDRRGHERYTIRHQHSPVSRPHDSATSRDSPPRDRRDLDRKKREREEEDEVLTPEQIRQKELQEIKEQYQSLDHKPKRRIPMPSDRYNSGWADSEDTSRDLNPLYRNPHESQILFGRGFAGGVDRRVQNKAAKKRADRHWTDKVLDKIA